MKKEKNVMEQYRIFGPNHIAAVQMLTEHPDNFAALCAMVFEERRNVASVMESVEHSLITSEEPPKERQELSLLCQKATEFLVYIRFANDVLQTESEEGEPPDIYKKYIAPKD